MREVGEYPCKSFELSASTGVVAEWRRRLMIGIELVDDRARL